MFSVVSCDNQEKNVGYGSMSVEISNSENSKTIPPTDESLVFTSYTIKGRYGTNEEWTVNESFFSKSIKIDHLEVGNWEFVVEGFNTDGVLLAKSEPHSVTIRTNGNAEETYILDWIDGFGSLKLSVNVQSSRISSIECQLYDESVNEVGDPYTIGKDSSVLGDDNFYLFEKVFEDVPTGFYNAKIVMKDKDGEPIGKTLHQSVHIHDCLESSFGFTWNGFPNFLPQVDVPKPNFDDGTSIPCDSKILLNTEEEGSSIFYSFDGKSYSSYTENGLDLSQMQDLSNSIKIWVYAEKANLNKSDVGTCSFSIEHNPDRENAVYKWNAIEGGYECVATSKCLYHQSLECETEKADVIYQIITDSTCSKEGVGCYTAAFAKDGYEKVQTKDEPIAKRMHTYTKTEKKIPTCTEVGMYECVCSVCSYKTFEEIPALGHDLVHHEAKNPTCTEMGWEAYDTCSDCDYTTYKEIPALGHNCSFRRVDDEYHEGVCSRCSETIKDVHSFKNYKCTECGTWDRGPSGGYVFYDMGKYTGGERSWRYLEAAPADLRLVNGVPTVDSTVAGYSDGTKGFIFGYYRETSGGSNVLLSTKTGIGEGYNNTDILVGKMQESAYTNYWGTGTTSNYAARLCKVLVYEVDGKDVTGWFLPSGDELRLMYKNLYKEGLGSFADDKLYWSSSEDDANRAWLQYFDRSNEFKAYSRNDKVLVRPVRAF